EAHAAIPAVAGGDGDFCFVDEFHGSESMSAEMKSPAEAGPFATRLRGSAGRDHVDRTTLLRALDGEFDGTVDQREQGVVAAQADARTRMELGAALADDDVAGLDGLAAVHLHAEVLRIGVAAVARGTYALLVCHGGFSLLLLAV